MRTFFQSSTRGDARWLNLRADRIQRAGGGRMLLPGALLSSLLALAAAGPFAAPACAQSIAITNVRIVDGNGGAPIEQGTIVVEGKKIVAVGARSKVAIPAGARKIDGGGKTAMPGLADMHVHLAGGWDGISTDLLGYKRYMYALLYAGVTTVLDTGNVEPYILQLRAETSAGRLLGPRIYCVGPLVDGPDSFWPALTAPLVSKDQVPGLVGRLAAEKVDLIKLYAGLSDLQVRAVSMEARKHGLRTIIDAHARNGSTDLMEEGIAGYAHFPSRKFSLSVRSQFRNRAHDAGSRTCHS